MHQKKQNYVKYVIDLLGIANVGREERYGTKFYTVAMRAEGNVVTIKYEFLS
jgi:hypothetical protein